MLTDKKYIINVYNYDGSTLLQNLASAKVKDNPKFSSKINGGLGECEVYLNLPFDNFGNGTTLKVGAICDVLCIDTSNPYGRRIFRGYISKYGSFINGSEQGVKLTIIGLVSLLTRSYYARATPVVHTTVDPQAIVEAVVDNFNTVFGGSMITYTHGTSTSTVGTNVSKSYTDKKWLDALNEAKDLAGAGWYWHVDADGLFSFKNKPSSATHLFVIGNHVQALEAISDGESVYNDFELRWSGGTGTDSDAASQLLHGTGSPVTGKNTLIKSDTSITDTGGRDQWLAKQKADTKDDKMTITMTINANYDLESIKVGQTCSIMNYDVNCTFFPTNMQIVGLSYNGDTVDLQLENITQNFGVVLQQYVKG